MSRNARGAELLVVDRLSQGVYRYSETGQFLGVVTQEIVAPGEQPVYLNQPTGVSLSPDFTKLYVSSSQHSHVVQYDYNRFTGAASNPAIFADASDGLAFPNDIRFSRDGSKIYVANLDGGVSRFFPDGSTAGAKLMLPTSAPGVATPTSSLNFTSTGQLLASAFQDANGAGGGIAITDPTVSTFSGYLVSPTPAINGAAGLMIHGDYIYASGLLRTNVRRFSLSTGQIDTSWGISGLGFPQDLEKSPDGQGFLVGVLGFSGGAGNISRYAYDGTFLGYFAEYAEEGEEGFTEATAFFVIPTPLVGDFNNDGAVDAMDYIVWRHASPTASLPNDDSPGAVDASDYSDWRANFGKSTTGSSSALQVGGVPEPASALLLLLAILAAGLYRNRT